ncbi:MAG: TRAP transporter substrate-binding protein [Gammaproteobacteria bacterium]
MPRLTRRSLLKSATAAGVLLCSPALIGRAYAQIRSLTVASLLGEDKPETLVWLKVRDLVEAQLPGQFSFNIVPNAALGGEREVAEGVRLGSVQAGLSTVSALTGWVPELQILDLPFLFRDAGHLRRVLDGDLGAGLKQRLWAQGFHAADYINYGARHLLAKEPISAPEQLRGMRIRVIQSPLHTQLWSAFGANPTAIPIPETYNALANGVVDAMDLTKSAYAGFKLYEVVPYLTETGHIWASGIVFFSSQFWNGLNEEQRAVFQSAAAAGAAYFDELITADETASMQIAAAAGGKIVAPEDLTAWEKGARAVWQSLAEPLGGMERIKAIRAIT